VGFIAYWRSTNDCDRNTGTPANPMKAIVHCEYGSPDVLTLVDVEKPTPADNQVLVRVRAASVNPLDLTIQALDQIGARTERRGVPAHPGSMLWLARIGRTAILGLPTCGAYSKATAADLLLPRLLTGEPPTLQTVSHLGHGGVLTREMRFRFPPYARELDAPDG